MVDRRIDSPDGCRSRVARRLAGPSVHHRLGRPDAGRAHHEIQLGRRRLGDGGRDARRPGPGAGRVALIARLQNVAIGGSSCAAAGLADSSDCISGGANPDGATASMRGPSLSIDVPACRSLAGLSAATNGASSRVDHLVLLGCLRSICGTVGRASTSARTPTASTTATALSAADRPRSRPPTSLVLRISDSFPIRVAATRIEARWRSGSALPAVRKNRDADATHYREGVRPLRGTIPGATAGLFAQLRIRGQLPVGGFPRTRRGRPPTAKNPPAKGPSIGWPICRATRRRWSAMSCCVSFSCTTIFCRRFRCASALSRRARTAMRRPTARDFSTFSVVTPNAVDQLLDQVDREVGVG